MRFIRRSVIIGLEKAIQELKDFKSKTGKIPLTKNEGMWSINYRIRKAEWKRYGVNTWYDLLQSAFGEIKIERNKYKGKSGLNNAVQALKEFERKSGRKPTSKDVGMRNIQNAICRGVWKKFGINYWNDLYKFTFGVNNERKSKFRGLKGLEKTAQVLREFETKYNKKPTSKNKEMRNILAAIYRGVWKEFRISTWKNLFDYAFNINELNYLDKEKE